MQSTKSFAVVILTCFVLPSLWQGLFAGEIQIEKALISPDGSHIVVKDTDGVIYIYDTRGHRQNVVKRLKTGDPEEDDNPWAMDVTAGDLHAVAPEAKLILIYSFFDGVQLIDREGVIKASLERPPLQSPGTVDSALFSRSGEQLLISGVGQSEDGKESTYLALYNTEGKIIKFALLPGPPFRGEHSSIAINEKKGIIIVAPPFNNQLYLVSYQPEISIQTLSIPGGRPEKVALSPSGAHIAWIGFDRKIYRASLQNLKTTMATSFETDDFLPVRIQFVPFRKKSGLISACDGYHGFLWYVKSEEAPAIFAAGGDEHITFQCDLSPGGSPTGLILFYGGNRLILYEGEGKLLFSATIEPAETEEETEEIHEAPPSDKERPE